MQNEKRLNLVEERIAWLQKHVLEQDKAMLEMSEEIARLRKQLNDLKSRDASGGTATGNTDERPPHY